MWERSIDFFVSHGFYVIAPDQRGYSFGARPSFIKDYSIDKLANDIIEISENENQDSEVSAEDSESSNS